MKVLLVLALMLATPAFASDANNDDQRANEAQGFLNVSEVTKDGDIDADKYVSHLVKEKWVVVTKTNQGGTPPTDLFSAGKAASGTAGSQPAPSCGGCGCYRGPPIVMEFTPTVINFSKKADLNPRMPASPQPFPSPAPPPMPETWTQEPAPAVAAPL